MKVVQGGVYVKINEIKASRIILGIVHGWEKDREREPHAETKILLQFIWCVLQLQ